MSEPIYDDPKSPVFPSATDNYGNGTEKAFRGIDVRAYIATKFGAALVSREGWRDTGQPREVAKSAILFADALIEELSK